MITIDREEIDRTGRGTVQDVLQTLPQNFAGSQNEATQEGTQNARSNFTYGSTVDLRGLGADATLTLVDGHRLAPAGVGGHIDISTIPLSAVERVEVLADGASAAYGASWIEATHGADARSAQSFTGLFTVRFDRPRNADALMHNPLGLFITEFSMSPETPASSYSRVRP